MSNPPSTASTNAALKALEQNNLNKPSRAPPRFNKRGISSPHSPIVFSASKDFSSTINLPSAVPHINDSDILTNRNALKVESTFDFRGREKDEDSNDLRPPVADPIPSSNTASVISNIPRSAVTDGPVDPEPGVHVGIEKVESVSRVSEENTLSVSQDLWNTIGPLLSGAKSLSSTVLSASSAAASVAVNIAKSTASGLRSFGDIEGDLETHERIEERRMKKNQRKKVSKGKPGTNGTIVPSELVDSDSENIAERRFKESAIQSSKMSDYFSSNDEDEVSSSSSYLSDDREERLARERLQRKNSHSTQKSLIATISDWRQSMKKPSSQKKPKPHSRQGEDSADEYKIGERILRTPGPMADAYEDSSSMGDSFISASKLLSGGASHPRRAPRSAKKHDMHQISQLSNDNALSVTFDHDGNRKIQSIETRLRACCNDNWSASKAWRNCCGKCADSSETVEEIFFSALRLGHPLCIVRFFGLELSDELISSSDLVDFLNDESVSSRIPLLVDISLDRAIFATALPLQTLAYLRNLGMNEAILSNDSRCEYHADTMEPLNMLKSGSLCNNYVEKAVFDNLVAAALFALDAGFPISPSFTHVNDQRSSLMSQRRFRNSENCDYRSQDPFLSDRFCNPPSSLQLSHLCVIANCPAALERLSELDFDSLFAATTPLDGSSVEKGDPIPDEFPSYEGTMFESMDLSAAQTPLHLSVLCQSSECAEVLLASAASPSARNARGQTPLHLALSADLCRMLAAAGADIAMQDSAGLSKLHYAAAYGSTGLLRSIWEGFVEHQRASAVRIAQKKLRTSNSHVGGLLTVHDAEDELQLVDLSGRRNDEVEVLGALPAHSLVFLMRGLLETLDAQHGRSALHFAAEAGMLDFSRALVTAFRVRTDVRDNYGYSALDLASFYEHGKVVQLLTTSNPEPHPLFLDLIAAIQEQELENEKAVELRRRNVIEAGEAKDEEMDERRGRNREVPAPAQHLSGASSELGIANARPSTLSEVAAEILNHPSQIPHTTRSAPALPAPSAVPEVDLLEMRSRRGSAVADVSHAGTTQTHSSVSTETARLPVHMRGKRAIPAPDGEEDVGEPPSSSVQASSLVSLEEPRESRLLKPSYLPTAPSEPAPTASEAAPPSTEPVASAKSKPRSTSTVDIDELAAELSETLALNSQSVAAVNETEGTADRVHVRAVLRASTPTELVEAPSRVGGWEGAQEESGPSPSLPLSTSNRSGIPEHAELQRKGSEVDELLLDIFDSAHSRESSSSSLPTETAGPVDLDSLSKLVGLSSQLEEDDPPTQTPAASALDDEIEEFSPTLVPGSNDDKFIREQAEAVRNSRIKLAAAESENSLSGRPLAGEDSQGQRPFDYEKACVNYRNQQKYRDAALGKLVLRCSVCKKNDVTKAMLPCLHAALCSQCIQRMRISPLGTSVGGKPISGSYTSSNDSNNNNSLTSMLDSAEKDVDLLHFHSCSVCLETIIAIVPISKTRDQALLTSVDNLYIKYSGLSPDVFTNTARDSLLSQLQQSEFSEKKQKLSKLQMNTRNVSNRFKHTDEALAGTKGTEDPETLNRKSYVMPPDSNALDSRFKTLFSHSGDKLRSWVQSAESARAAAGKSPISLPSPTVSDVGRAFS